MNWKDAALAHAKDQDPKESCGLLLNIKGKERYFPCRNLSMTAYQCFIIDPEDYIKADNTGDIIAVVHSHPVTPPVASQSDKVACEQSGLVWHIVNPKTESWGYLEPTGYKAPILGREWAWGVTDCYTLVRDWYKEKLNIDLIDWHRPTTLEEFNKNPMFEKCAEETGFRELNPDEKLINGDLLFMSILSNNLNHVGIFVDGDVLHHLTDRLSCIEPYSEWLLKCTGKRLRYVA
ncbi:C40 family peptidase [Marinobacter sp.]|jgi:proteasome lid subunit RPN8/RPN11|uniref:C40 family peptidase n=1 Tax=Marinobacter sp. TaxID=50741 RepID=UPI000C92755D|nr:C40 family peptidase [Marinobacter sp.]MAK52180.1 peptidase P60 [Marinobacter sp.]